MRSRVFGQGGLLLCAGLLSAGLLGTPASASAEECTGLLPDLRCEREARFDGFVPPMSQPYYFEEPFVTTGVSLWALYHEFPEGSVFQGGNATDFAAQVRVALTDRLGLIATQDGRLTIRANLGLLGTRTGYTDWMFGLKYVLVYRPEDRLIVTPSLRYKTANGDHNILSGRGGGGWLPAVSVGKGFGAYNFVGDLGLYQPVDGDAESQFLFYHLHVSRPWTEWLTPFVELNGLHYTDSGDGSTVIKLKGGARASITAVQSLLQLSGFEGYDVANLGSKNVEGNDVISGAVGVRVPVNRYSSVGLSYEFPVTTRRDILKQRVTMNITLEY